MNNLHNSDPAADPGRRFPWPRIFIAAAVILILVAIFLPRQTKRAAAVSRHEPAANATESDAHAPAIPHVRHVQAGPNSSESPEEIVARKLSQFARNRRGLVDALALHYKVQVPDEVKRFFDAVEAGRFDEAKALFDSMKTERYAGGNTNLTPYWRAIVEAEGASEQVHAWPARKLLDYGNAVLGALHPGMAYLGGDDPGCFIPTMLDATSDGEQHIILTQNALADSSYLDYLSFLYGGRLNVPTSQDSQNAFQAYMDDAKKRMLHDQQFPNEPKQVLPGETITLDNGRVQASGQVAVMGINELLVQTLLQKNPDLSFALEESFPLKSTYSDATTLGPVMELRAATDGQSALTAEGASQSVEYWQSAEQALLSDPTTPDGSDVRKSYGHLALAQANLLASHQFTDQAAQAYQVASSLWPDSMQVLSQYSSFLAGAGRVSDANLLIDNYIQSYPANRVEASQLKQRLQPLRP